MYSFLKAFLVLMELLSLSQFYAPKTYDIYFIIVVSTKSILCLLSSQTTRTLTSSASASPATFQSTLSLPLNERCPAVSSNAWEDSQDIGTVVWRAFIMFFRSFTVAGEPFEDLGFTHFQLFVSRRHERAYSLINWRNIRFTDFVAVCYQNILKFFSRFCSYCGDISQVGWIGFLQWFFQLHHSFSLHSLLHSFKWLHVNFFWFRYFLYCF